MLAISASLIATLVVPMVSAVPFGFPGFQGGHSFVSKLTGCSLTNAKLTLPSTAPAAGMAVPTSEKAVFVALGRGVQNYTCTAGVYGVNQAVATLFDASCGMFHPLACLQRCPGFLNVQTDDHVTLIAVGTPLLTQLPKLAMVAPRGPTLPSTCSGAIGNLKLGDHYFQKLSADATSANPVFDFR